MIRLNIKPLSLNAAYSGVRYKTKACNSFKKDLYFMLPNIRMPPPPYCIHFKFGVSSASSDGDNLIKVSQDTIADRYEFNDKLIKKWIVEVEQVKKGFEYIEFKIESF
jgi:hypothetical protein